MAVIILNLLANSRFSALKRIFLLVDAHIPGRLLGAVRTFPDRSQIVSCAAAEVTSRINVASDCGYAFENLPEFSDFATITTGLAAVARSGMDETRGDLVLVGDDRLKRRSGPSAHREAP